MRLIDADELIKKFKEWIPKCGSELLESGIHPVENIAVSALMEIEEAPTIEAEPVVYGKWEWNENAIDWGLGAWVCSKCYSTNDNIHARRDGNPLFWKGSQRCPVCGARMMSYTPLEPYKGNERL